jgi:hypothetical protein
MGKWLPRIFGAQPDSSILLSLTLASTQPDSSTLLSLASAQPDSRFDSLKYGQCDNDFLSQSNFLFL